MAFVAYTVLEGIREAHLFYYKVESGKYIMNEHVIFMMQRVLVVMPLGLFIHWLYLVSFVLMFPFIHDGVYYVIRNAIKKGTYPKGFFTDKSTTSTAKMEIGLELRVLMLIVGAIILSGCLLAEV